MSGEALRIWAAREGTLNVCGRLLSHGQPEDGFLKFTPPAQFSRSHDIQGNGARARTSDPWVDVTCKLWNWSKHNAEFSLLHALDTNSNKGEGVGIFSWIDNQGQSVVTSDTCYIDQPPEWDVKAEAFVVEWKLCILAPPMFRIFGGN